MKNWMAKVIPIVDVVLVSAVLYLYLGNGIPTIRQLIGIITTFIGFTLVALARIHLGQSFAVNPSAKDLVTHGFYSKLKHPIYYFGILGFIGVALFFWSTYVTIGVFVLFLVQLYRMREENKVLRATFGARYERYVSSVWF